MRVIIVEAGLSGLTCAKVLREGGAEVAAAFEASAGVGADMATDGKDGSVLSGARATREVFG